MPIDLRCSYKQSSSSSGSSRMYYWWECRLKQRLVLKYELHDYTVSNYIANVYLYLCSIWYFIELLKIDSVKELNVFFSLICVESETEQYKRRIDAK